MTRVVMPRFVMPRVVMPRAAMTSALALVLLLAVAPAAAAQQYAVGDRQFPSTPLTEDPFVADALYTGFQHLRQSGGPDFGANRLGFGLEKRITDRLGVSLGGAYEILTPLGQGNVYGWDNLYATLKYQAFESAAHETVVSLGVEREFGGVGASRVEAEPVGATTPTVYAAKGFGDLPDGLKFLRPLAVTGSFGYQIPDARAHGDDRFPDVAEIGLSLQYSLRYLQGNVEYVGLPPLIGRLTPIVEFSYAVPVSSAFGQTPTGIVAPGVVYSDNGFDVSLEALLPINRRSGIGAGVIAELRIPLDRISDRLAKPLFAD
jgi:hypothetical protein